MIKNKKVQKQEEGGGYHLELSPSQADDRSYHGSGKSLNFHTKDMLVMAQDMLSWYLYFSVHGCHKCP